MTTAAAFIVALKASLETRFAGIPAMQSVRLFIVQPDDISATESVVLVANEILGTQVYAAMGRRRRDDEWRIPGFVQTYGTDPNASEAFRKAIERAAVIIGEIEAQLRDSPPMVGDTLKGALLEEVSFQPFVSEKGGWICRGNFTTAHSARVA